MKPGLTTLRTLVGGLFVGHGTQKLFGAFGGGGPDGTAQFFEMAGLRPGKRNAYAAGAGEALGGALFAIHRATPVAGTLMAGTMWTAIWAVHKDKGPWVTDGGWEYPAVLLAAFAAVTEEDHGALVALGTLAAGALGAAAVIASSPAPAGDGPVEAASGTETTQEPTRDAPRFTRVDETAPAATR
jgi:putative oxidoreductase